MDRPEKITVAEMRASGVYGLLIYCADYRCDHSMRISADQWPDDVRLSDLEDRFVYTAYGKRLPMSGRISWDTKEVDQT